MYSGNYRAPFIDYTEKGIFMITILGKSNYPPFSKIINTGKTVNLRPFIYPELSCLGQSILKSFLKFEETNKKIKILRKVIMPDHIHFIIYISEKLEEPVGKYIVRLKKFIVKNAIEENIIPTHTTTIFEAGFNDQFFPLKRNISILKKYIDDNPYRYWMKRNNPHFFQIIRDVNINGYECNLYGNHSLLEFPVINPIVIHRKDNDEVLLRKIEKWNYAIYNGGIIAGAFISPKEKEIYHKALENNSKIILISPNSYSERSKPYGRLFEHCKNGNLLIISPKIISERPYFLKNDKISRKDCVLMNEIAESFSAG